jgi:hypothetical protein
MKIGFLTTWSSKCGIYEYSRNLVGEITNLGNEIRVFANFTKAFEEPFVVENCFGVTFWGEPTVLDVNKILANSEDLDIFHVQYHSSLYKHPEFMKLIKELSRREIKLVITLHDSSRHPGTNIEYFNEVIYHKEGILHERVWGNEWLLPYPIQERRPCVFSFGMGRNDYELIQKVCRELDIDFYKHDSKVDGWLAEMELFGHMRAADAIVLWYNEVPGLVGASAAARTALASRRPVIVNNASWFDDLDEDYYRFVYDEKELKEVLAEELKLDHIHSNSFGELAKKNIKIYKGDT